MAGTDGANAGTAEKDERNAKRQAIIVKELTRESGP